MVQKYKIKMGGREKGEGKKQQLFFFPKDLWNS